MNRNHKRIKACLITLILIGSISVLVAPLSGGPNRMEQYKYYEYESSHFQFRSEIVEHSGVTAASVTVNEIYTQGDIEIQNTNIYDLNTRQIIYPEWRDYYAWTWINEDDTYGGTVYAADKELYLFDTTPDFYVFNYSEASGSNGLVYYDIDTLMLVKTEDNIVIENDTIENNLMFSTEGYDYTIGGHFEDPVNISQSVNMTQEELISHYEHSSSQIFFPPYYTASGDKYTWKQFISQVGADWEAYASGYIWGYGETFAGPIIGRAIAQSWSWIRGPGGIGRFSPNSNGNYKITLNFIIDGVAETSISLPSWLGSGRAHGDIDLTGILYEYGTGYIVKEKTKVLYEARAPPILWNYQSWDEEVHQISFNGNLYSNKWYFFEGELYQEHRAGALFFAVAGTESSMEAFLVLVAVTKL